MAKYFLVNYETFPIDHKKNVHILQYINFSILALLFTAFIKKGEQVITTSTETTFKEKISPLKTKALKVINKERKLLKDTLKQAPKKITEFVNILEEDLQPTTVPAQNNHTLEHSDHAIAHHTNDHTSTDTTSTVNTVDSQEINKDINTKDITIHIKKTLNNDELSILLLAIFEELQTLGEDESYVDVERNHLGTVSLIHIKGLKNFTSEKLNILLSKISKDTGASLHKS